MTFKEPESLNSRMRAALEKDANEKKKIPGRIRRWLRKVLRFLSPNLGLGV
jgi:hypothetical protein